MNMSDLQALTTLNSDPVACSVKRAAETLNAWADRNIDVAVSGGSSDTAISSPTLDHVVVWTFNGRTYPSTISTTGTQSDLDAAVAAFKARVVANGGTVVSG